METQLLKDTIRSAFEDFRTVRASFVAKLEPEETGTVVSVGAGIATVSGLHRTGFEELLQFPGGLLGISFNLDRDVIGVVLLGDAGGLRAGDKVLRTGRVTDVPVGAALLGRVVNPLGEPLDGGVSLETNSRLPIERPAAPIMDRKAVSRPLQTGIKVIDALIPVGRGQRELILGDRQTGKTAIAIDTIMNQKGKDVFCVYCSIGQRAASVAKVIAQLRNHGAMEYTTVVATEGSDAPGLQYIAPYAATSIAEYLMEKGKDVLIVYDDLTHHARAYRELSLLLRRPPGREAFPGDIFYIHSRLLERSTHLNDRRGNGSLTAFPIIETEAQNLSAYIPTNLISITDGQLYLSPKLFDLGVMPAVDVGKSVSRVGGKAQLPAYRALAGNLKLNYSQFEELETFTRFGTKLDGATQRVIEHGKRIRACFIQPEMQPAAVGHQLLVLLSLSNGLLDTVSPDQIPDAEDALGKLLDDLPPGIREKLNDAVTLNADEQSIVLDLSRNLLAPLSNPI